MRAMEASGRHPALTDRSANLTADPSFDPAEVQSPPDDCHDVAWALARVTDMIFAVTGKPVTHLIDFVSTLNVAMELSSNEKSAVEAAIGASAVGVPTCVIVKHCGLAYALDSLANAALHGTGAGLLIVSGDDCNADSSTCIYDSRQLAEIARLPVIDLALAGDTDAVVDAALRMSASARIPVVLRVTASLHAACSPDRRTPEARSSAAGQHSPNPDLIDREVAHGLTKLGRHQHHRLVTTSLLREKLAQPPMVSATCAAECDRAVIASGAASRYLPDGDYCRLQVQGVSPVPDAVIEFARRHRQVLVVEEPAPYLETALRASHAALRSTIMGRMDSWLPPEGSLSPGQVAAAMADEGPQEWSAVARKTPGAKPESPYSPVFEAVARLQRTGVFVTADVGSSIQLCYPPYNAASVAISLGSAVGVAGGAARAGQRSLAVIGDYALTHSAVESLLDVVAQDLPVLVLVLANGNQTQTGGQELPAADRTALVQACGVRLVEHWPATCSDEAFTRLHQLLGGPLPAVAFVTADEPH
ncbi:thiamine pyrophosphate-dependent enzyme [Catellatospora methionotrophica]|uniref:thiamine pyrophosphate-dependent enzyme n=1 Tax=Catellatospora methionotrophica TaxID=121620 RepID=UPI0033C439AC